MAIDWQESIQVHRERARYHGAMAYASRFSGWHADAATHAGLATAYLSRMRQAIDLLTTEIDLDGLRGL